VEHNDSPAAIESGPFTLDLLRPPPSPAPVMTIAWRMAHLIVGVLGTRVAAQFGGRQKQKAIPGGDC
jgi:hypothetical protein